mmetsp:Transcript_31701/g.53636  ORF Transcript_31701/g.53636 Transcript_31701/m.53636 type:complete len:231 (+) Transcript_31701:1026-1718(+)
MALLLPPTKDDDVVEDDDVVLLLLLLLSFNLTSLIKLGSISAPTPLLLLLLVLPSSTIAAAADDDDDNEAAAFFFFFLSSIDQLRAYERAFSRFHILTVESPNPLATNDASRDMQIEVDDSALRRVYMQIEGIIPPPPLGAPNLMRAWRSFSLFCFSLSFMSGIGTALSGGIVIGCGATRSCCDEDDMLLLSPPPPRLIPGCNIPPKPFANAMECNSFSAGRAPQNSNFS